MRWGWSYVPVTPSPYICCVTRPSLSPVHRPQKASGDAALFWHVSVPRCGLCPHRSMQPHELNTVDEQKKKTHLPFSAKKKKKRKDYSCTTWNTQPWPNIAFGLPSLSRLRGEGDVGKAQMLILADASATLKRLGESGILLLGFFLLSLLFSCVLNQGLSSRLPIIQ